MSDLTVQIIGLPELLKKLDGNVLLAGPVTKAFNQSLMTLESGAKRLTPVDTGRLRASITHRLDGQPIPRWGEVGTDVSYAPYVHYGREPGSMPPPSALATWARRHGGGNPFALAMAIMLHGIKPKPFLANALKAAEGQIQGYFAAAAREIESLWGR
jgi:hypothetical protein